jgi:hypothetical protein
MTKVIIIFMEFGDYAKIIDDLNVYELTSLELNQVKTNEISSCYY